MSGHLLGWVRNWVRVVPDEIVDAHRRIAQTHQLVLRKSIRKVIIDRCCAHRLSAYTGIMCDRDRCLSLGSSPAVIEQQINLFGLGPRRIWRECDINFHGSR